MPESDDIIPEAALSTQPTASSPSDDLISSSALGQDASTPAKASSPNEVVGQLVRHEASSALMYPAALVRHAYDVTLGGRSATEADKRQQEFLQEHTTPLTDPDSQRLGQIYQDVQTSKANPLSWPGKVIDATGNLVGKINPELGSATKDALQVAGMLAPGMAKATPVSASAASVEQALKEGQKLGYVVPPATSNPSVLNRGLEGVAGKLSVAQGASVKNQQITDGLVRKEFGLPQDEPLTHEKMADIREEQGIKGYEPVKQVTDIDFGQKYSADLDKLTTTANKVSKALPNYKTTGSQQVQELIDSLKPQGGKMDGETAVELSKSLRSEASAHESTAARTGDPQSRTLARAYRGAAEAVEDAVERHLNNIGQPELAENWDNARRTIAKTYSVQNALDGAGHVDATKLGKQLLKDKRLSGNLKAAANFANVFPKAARNLKESMPGMSPLDMFAGMAIDAGTGNHAGLAIGPARMATRGALLGPIGQKLAMPKGPPAPAIGRLSSFVAPIAAKDQNQNDQ
jgi:hypothetical protein